MRIGVTTDALNTVDGGFHYEVVFFDALSELADKFPAEFVLFPPPETNLVSLAGTGGLRYRNLGIRPLYRNAIQQGPPQLYLQAKPPSSDLDPDSFIVDRHKALALREAKIDLVLQLGPYAYPFTAVLPFVMAVYDLNHRLQPEFPEVSAFGEFNRREYLYCNICRYATLVLVDSEAGKEDLLRFYGRLIGEDRIRVLPYYPPIEKRPMPDARDCERVRRTYSLPPKYFFYPAQFWRHKNHALILRALRLIEDETREKIPVVLCGIYADYFRAANFQELGALAAQLNVADRILYLGPVPGDDMPALFTLSAGLVMPTFFGPTNIPPLEAWHYGRPVITSNIRGLREQNGDASLLVDPRSPVDLARAMLELWRSESLAAELAARGKKRLSSYNWSTFVDGVGSIMSEACERVRTGRTPKFPDVDLGA
jgi:glycosyltransferase involved in cell wall biosynthesis